MGDPFECSLEELRLGVADEIAERSVDLQEATVHRDQRHPDGRMVERVCEARLARLQRLLRPLSFGDVGHDPRDAAGLARVVEVEAPARP